MKDLAGELLSQVDSQGEINFPPLFTFNFSGKMFEVALSYIKKETLELTRNEFFIAICVRDIKKEDCAILKGKIKTDVSNVKHDFFSSSLANISDVRGLVGEAIKQLVQNGVFDRWISSVDLSTDAISMYEHLKETGEVTVEKTFTSQRPSWFLRVLNLAEDSLFQYVVSKNPPRKAGFTVSN